MQRVILIFALLCAALPAAADVYKWVDSEGKIHYSDTPPAKGAAKTVDLPKVIVESKPAENPVVEQKPGAEPAQVAVAAQAPAAPAPQVSRGMSEGELMQRAGPPDFDSTDGTVGSAVVSGRKRNLVESFNNLELRKLYYYPTQSDPFTSVVTLTGGMISDLQRTRKF